MGLGGEEGSFYLFIFANKAGRFDLTHTYVKSHDSCHTESRILLWLLFTSLECSLVICFGLVDTVWGSIIILSTFSNRNDVSKRTMESITRAMFLLIKAYRI